MFQDLYEDILDALASSSSEIIYETNMILKRPEGLFQAVKKAVKSGNPETKINIFKALEDCPKLNDENPELLSTLKSLFIGHESAYFIVKVEHDGLFIDERKGEFSLPPGFLEIGESNELHYSYPRIRRLALDKKLFSSKLNALKKNLDTVKDFYARKQETLKTFRSHILDFDCFGTITIWPDMCTEDDNDTDNATLDETIEHECQHLCIFLMSLAKTCIWYGLHFSNSNVYLKSMKYELRESEFITLAGSYCNILMRIFKKLPEPKNYMKFIKAAIETFLFGNTSEDQKYADSVKSSAQFTKIRDLYKLIYNDSRISICLDKEKTKKIGDFKNSKFDTLVKWTIKNFEQNGI